MKRHFCLLLTVLFVGCGGEGTAKEFFDFTQTIAPGSGDLWNAAVLVQDVDPCSGIHGTIEERWEVHGVTVGARAGQALHVVVDAWAGAGSTDRTEGESLDTVAAVYGPMEGWRPGGLLAYADDSGSHLGAVLEPVDVPVDGRYMAVMAVWDDPGQGWFELDLLVEGAGCDR
jgi:hypothetical protein